MTLIAAYRSAGVPILLGDFLISSRDERKRGRKKICRIRNNLAVGWTGKLLNAETVLARMYDELGDRPTKESLSDWFLSLNIEADPSPSLKLVGWISDEEGETGFHWDPAVQCVTWGDEWFVGSGGEAFEASFMRYRSPLNTKTGSDARDSLEGLLATLAQLNCTDMLNQEGHELGVGGGYEALYWSSVNAEFKYVNNVLYFILACRMNAEGKLKQEGLEVLEDRIASYKSTADEFSVLAIADSEDLDSHNIWVMSPVGPRRSRDKLFKWLRKEAGLPMDMSADYYAGLVAFASPLTSVPPLPVVACPWDRQNRLQGSRGKFEFKISSDEIEQLYAKQAASYVASPYPLGAMQILRRD